MCGINLGSKIKELRKKRNLTQSELSGDFMTRNMLSRIENGSATPSLETLCYISKRLEISPGWLLEDNAELAEYEKGKYIKSIKELFAGKKYADCELECVKYLSDTNDDELCIIAAECSYNLAFENLTEGKFVSANMLFQKTLGYNSRGLISIRVISQAAQAFIDYLTLIYTKSRLRDDFTGCRLPDILPPYEGAFCIKLNILIKNGEYRHVRACLEAGEIEGTCREQVYAALSLAEGNLEAAETKYRQLVQNAKLPAEIMYIACSELERIARLNDKYKLAYACAEKKLEIISRAGK